MRAMLFIGLELAGELDPGQRNTEGASAALAVSAVIFSLCSGAESAAVVEAVVSCIGPNAPLLLLMHKRTGLYKILQQLNRTNRLKPQCPSYAAHETERIEAYVHEAAV